MATSSAWLRQLFQDYWAIPYSLEPTHYFVIEEDTTEGGLPTSGASEGEEAKRQKFNRGTEAAKADYKERNPREIELPPELDITFDDEPDVIV